VAKMKIKDRQVIFNFFVAFWSLLTSWAIAINYSSLILLLLILPLIILIYHLNPHYKYFSQGIKWFKLANYETAIEYFSKAIEVKPNYYLAYYFRALSYYGCEENLPQMLLDLKQTMRLNPKFVEVYIGLGLYYLYLENYPLALHNFDFVISQQPRSGIAYYIRACYKLQLGDLESATLDVEKAMSLNVGVTCHILKSEILFGWGQFQLAIASIDKLIESVHVTYVHYYQRGYIYYHQQNYQTAIADFSMAIELKETDLPSYYSRGNCKYELGDLEGAKSDYKIAFSLEETQKIRKEDEHGYYARGICQANLNNLDLAKLDLLKAQQLCEKHKNSSILISVRSAIDSL
jgi:tetratricopeptide (TPR) repeat protein